MTDPTLLRTWPRTPSFTIKGSAEQLFDGEAPHWGVLVINERPTAPARYLSPRLKNLLNSLVEQYGEGYYDLIVETCSETVSGTVSQDDEDEEENVINTIDCFYDSKTGLISE